MSHTCDILNTNNSHTACLRGGSLVSKAHTNGAYSAGAVFFNRKPAKKLPFTILTSVGKPSAVPSLSAINIGRNDKKPEQKVKK